MDASTTKLSSNPAIEIIPPLQVSRRSTFINCLCCNRSRTPEEMDEDGCGICNECLEPRAERWDTTDFEVALAQLP
jgi:hypothetical protein